MTVGMTVGMKVDIVERQWHGCRYQTAHPYLTGWSLTENQNTWAAMESWCIVAFGEPGDAFSTVAERWYLNNRCFWFRNDADLTAFLLRWT